MQFVNCAPLAAGRNLSGFQRRGALYRHTVASAVIGDDYNVAVDDHVPPKEEPGATNGSGGDDDGAGDCCTRNIGVYGNCDPPKEEPKPMRSNGDWDAADVDGYYNCVSVKEEPKWEFAATDSGGGDGANGDDYARMICVTGYYDPLKTEPKSELGGGSGDVGDGYCDYGPPKEEPESKYLLKQEPEPELKYLLKQEPEPELADTVDGAVDDGGRYVGYDCSHCGISLSTEEFKVQHELRCTVHMKQKELESQVTKLYHCIYCSCPFLNEEYMEQHQKKWCRKRPVAAGKDFNGTYFKCEECEYVTKRKLDLKRHHLTHNKDDSEWFACTQCSYKTVHKLSMTRHTKIHGNAFSCCCPICGKTFRRKTCLDDHLLKQHSNEPDEVSKLITSKVYTCNICDKFRTTVKSNYNQHVSVTHNKGVGCKKYECPRCPYSTFCKGSLTKHSKMHAGQRDYQCAVCKKQLTQKMDLDSHILSYHADNVDLVKTITSKMHRCALCSFKTVIIDRLKTHVRSKHV